MLPAQSSKASIFDADVLAPLMLKGTNRFGKYVAHVEAQNMITETLDCWATEVRYEAKMGQNSTFRTSMTSVISFQTCQRALLVTLLC